MEQQTGRDIVGYFRVSTQMQGTDGLGMDAQRSSIAAYAKTNRCRILAAYEEVETGRRGHLHNRPELRKAIAHARRASAVLVIARIDRLARNVLVTAQLLESGVEFVACDNPHTNRLTIQIMAAMAEHESRLISERVKAAFAERRARGLPHPGGTLKFNPEVQRRAVLASAAARIARTRAAYADLVPMIIRLRMDLMTLKEIAAHLNAIGHRTQGGRNWKASCVSRLLIREGLTHLRKRPFPPALSQASREKGLRAFKLAQARRTREADAVLAPLALALHKQSRGFTFVARGLNNAGYKTLRGTPWRGETVAALLVRQGAISKDWPRPPTNPDVMRKVTAAAAIVNRRRAREGYANVIPFIVDCFQSGDSLNDIASRLNRLGYKTRRGNQFDGTRVKSVLKRELKYVPLALRKAIGRRGVHPSESNARRERARNIKFLGAVQRFRDLGLTYHAIAIKLNASGYRTNRNTSWCGNSLRARATRESARASWGG